MFQTQDKGVTELFVDLLSLVDVYVYVRVCVYVYVLVCVCVCVRARARAKRLKWLSQVRLGQVRLGQVFVRDCNYGRIKYRTQFKAERDCVYI